MGVDNLWLSGEFDTHVQVLLLIMNDDTLLLGFFDVILDSL